MLVVQKFARSNAMLYCYMSAGEGLVLLLSFGFLRSVGICGYLVSIWNLSLCHYFSWEAWLVSQFLSPFVPISAVKTTPLQMHNPIDQG